MVLSTLSALYVGRVLQGFKLATTAPQERPCASRSVDPLAVENRVGPFEVLTVNGTCVFFPGSNHVEHGLTAAAALHLGDHIRSGQVSVRSVLCADGFERLDVDGHNIEVVVLLMEYLRSVMLQHPQ